MQKLSSERARSEGEKEKINRSTCGIPREDVLREREETRGTGTDRETRETKSKGERAREMKAGADEREEKEKCFRGSLRKFATRIFVGASRDGTRNYMPNSRMQRRKGEKERE